MANTDLIVRLLGDTSRLRSDLAKANGSLNKFKKTAMAVGGAVGIAFGGREIIRAIGVGIKKVADFEYQMDTVAAVSRASGKAIQNLSDNALDLGRKSKFTATQIGSMQETLARLGYSARQIVNTTDAVKDLAIATGEDLADSAMIAASTMKSFDLEVYESSRVANVMAESFATTSLNLEKYGNAMANAGVLSKISNVSLEKTTAILGTLVDRNIEAGKAGTDLRRILINLADKGIDFNDALLQIRTSTNKVKTATDLFGARAAAAGVIIAENEGKINDLTKSYEDNNKELQKMVDTMEDNLQTDLVKLQSAFEGIILKGGVLSGTLRELVQGLTALANQANDNTSAFGSLIEKWKKFTPAGWIMSKWMYILGENTKEYTDKLNALNKVQKETNLVITEAVKDAFSSGNVDEYIKNLKEGKTLAEQINMSATEMQDYLIKQANQEEIITRIRERQKKISDALLQDEKDRLKVINQLVSAKNAERKASEGMHTLSTKGYQGELSISGETPQLDGLKEVQDRYLAQQEEFNKRSEQLAITGRENAEAIANGISGLITSFAQAIASGEKPLKAAGRLILGTIGGLLTKLGTTMIASGIGLSAATAALSNPFTAGPAAIAAGIIVAGIGAAMSSFAGGMTSVSASGGGSSGFASSSNNRSSGYRFMDKNEKIEVGGSFELKGNVLVAAIEKANRQKRITG